MQDDMSRADCFMVGIVEMIWRKQVAYMCGVLEPQVEASKYNRLKVEETPPKIAITAAASCCRWEVASHPPTRPPTPTNAPPSSNSSNGDGKDSAAGGSGGSGGGGSHREGDSVINKQAAQAGSGLQGAAEGQGLASSILLQLHRGASVGPGQELCINYGDTKSNEELLLLYGFVYDPDLAGVRGGQGSGSGSEEGVCSKSCKEQLLCGFVYDSDLAGVRVDKGAGLAV
eukprot:1157733-Pelagomonas_calceolata.AAC.4